MTDINLLKNTFRHFLSDVNILLKNEGLLNPSQRFWEFSALFTMKLLNKKARKNVGKTFKFNHSWQDFSELESKAMLQALNQVMLPALVKSHPQLNFFPKKSRIKNPLILKKIVDKLSNFDLSVLGDDVLSSAYEYFLHQNALQAKQALGVYFTPSHLVRLILDLIPLKAGDTIYDPTCGAGGFLVEAFKIFKERLKKYPKTFKKPILFGREISDAIHIARLNLMMVGANADALCQMDTLKVPVKTQFSVVLANFPFSQKTEWGTRYGFKGRDANPIFLKHIIDALKPGGIAGVIVPDKLLFHENPEYIQIRKELLETCQVLSVIQLHEYVFMPYTKQPTHLILFKKGGYTKSVWFFEVREDGFKKTGSLLNQTLIRNNDFNLLKTLWEDKPNSTHSFSVPSQKILQENYQLAMNHYKKPHFPSWAKLGDLCNIVVGETPRQSNANFYGGKHLFVRIKDLNQRVIKKTTITLSDAGVRQTYVKPFKRGTLLFSFRLSIAKVAFAGERLYASESVAGLTLKKSIVLSRYLYYVLPHLDYSSYLNRGTKGQELNRSILAAIQIPLPSLSKQKRLVQCLERQEKNKALLLKQIKKLDLLQTKSIQRLITAGANR